LLRELAAESGQLFQTSGFHPHKQGAKPIGDLLAEAWSYFRANPSGFPQWEREQLQQLRKAFNLI
jgi:hypothetical protein